MRLVDLLLTPRPSSHGGGPTAVTTGRSSYQGPSQSVQPTPRTKKFDSMTSLQNMFQHPHIHDPSITRQVSEKPSRSTGVLSELLRSSKSPTSRGYRNQLSMATRSSSLTTDLSSLLQQDDASPDFRSGIKLERDNTTSGSGSANLTLKSRTGEMSKFAAMVNGDRFPRKSFSFSSSSSPSSSSESSIGGGGGGGGRASPYRRRVSLLSSDGSELEQEQFLPSMVDSDGYESLSPPLEEMEAIRWTAAEKMAAGGGCCDWKNAEEEDGDRFTYEFDAGPLFNFFGGSFGDLPFESLDSVCYAPKYDNSEVHGLETGFTPVAMTTDDMEFGSPRQPAINPAAAVQSSSSEFGPNELDFDSAAAGADSASDLLLSPSDANPMRFFVGCNDLHGLGSTSFPPAATCCPPVSCPAQTRAAQSEVVKLLLQNRHQWAPRQEKSSQPAAARGTRKRAPSSSNNRGNTPAKTSRSSRPVPMATAERRHSVPPPAVTSQTVATPYQSDDQSTNLERLITELMLFESVTDTSAYSASSPTPSTSMIDSASEAHGPEAPLVTSSELFEGLSIGMTSDGELFASLGLDSIYTSECEALFALQEGLGQGIQNGVDVVVKTEPGKPQTPSSAPFQLGPEAFSTVATLNCQKGYTAPPNQAIQNSAVRPSASFEILDHEHDFQTKLLQNLDGIESKTAKETVVVDHDYCQNLGILPTGLSFLRDLENDQKTLEKRRLFAETCLARRGDNSTLRSLLLDSNLTEEVRREAEVVRAKSRKRMAEKLPPVTVRGGQPLRLDRGVSTQERETPDDACFARELMDAEKALQLMCKNTVACDGAGGEGGGHLAPDQIKQELETESTEESALYSTYSSLPGSSCDFYPSTLQDDSAHDPSKPEIPELTVDANAAGCLDTCLTSELEFPPSGDVDVMLFDSFEDFYNRNNDSGSTCIEEDENNAVDSSPQFGNSATPGEYKNPAKYGESKNSATSGESKNFASSGESKNSATSGEYKNFASSGESKNSATSDESKNSPTSGESKLSTVKTDKQKFGSLFRKSEIRSFAKKIGRYFSTDLRKGRVVSKDGRRVIGKRQRHLAKETNNDNRRKTGPLCF